MKKKEKIFSATEFQVSSLSKRISSSPMGQTMAREHAFSCLERAESTLSKCYFEAETAFKLTFVVILIGIDIASSLA